MLAYWQAILDEAGTHAIGAQDVLEMYRPSNYDTHAAAAFVAADGDFTVRCAQRRIADLLVPAGVRVFEYVPPIATAPLRAPARTCMAYTHARVRTPRQSPAPNWMDDRPSRQGRLANGRYVYSHTSAAGCDQSVQRQLVAPGDLHWASHGAELRFVFGESNSTW